MADAPPFVPLNDLERLLVAAATEEDARPAFTRALMDTQLFAVSPDALPQGDQVMLAATNVSLMMIPLENGSNATAVFTAPERATVVYGADAHLLGMAGRDLIGMVAAQPLLLNPGLGYGVLWSPEDLAMLVGRPLERTVAQDTTVMLGSPQERPDDLINRLTAAFQPVSGVQAVWLALAQWPDQAEFAWYLDIRSDLSPDDLGAILTRAVDGADMAGKHLDMRVSPLGGEPGVGITVIAPH